LLRRKRLLNHEGYIFWCDSDFTEERPDLDSGSDEALDLVLRRKLVLEDDSEGGGHGKSSLFLQRIVVQ